jgi:hypothetical protein
MCLPYIFFRVQGHYTAAFQYYQKTKQFTAQFCPKSTQFQLATGEHPKAITKQKLDCQKENQKRSLNRNPLNHPYYSLGKLHTKSLHQRKLEENSSLECFPGD